jgi:hypothetical protein
MQFRMPKVPLGLFRCCKMPPQPTLHAGMRVLVLSSDPGLADVPRHMCMAYGIPCDIVQLTRQRQIQTPGVCLIAFIAGVSAA